LKINFTKLHGGVLVPFDDMEADRMSKFRTNEVYDVEIKKTRNPQFHRKMFAFFKFCFNYWASDKEFIDEQGQFEVFRNQLTCLAGFYNEYYKLDGSVRIEAKSLSYANMEPEEFEKCYKAVIQAALKHLFPAGCGVDENRLLDFF